MGGTTLNDNNQTISSLNIQLTTLDTPISLLHKVTESMIFLDFTCFGPPQQLIGHVPYPGEHCLTKKKLSCLIVTLLG